MLRIPIHVQNKNPTAIKTLGLQLIEDADINEFVKNYPKKANLCLNIGYTSRPIFDLSKLSNITEEPVRAFADGSALLRSNGKKFKLLEVRDKLGAEVVGIANVDNQFIAR